MFPTLIYEFFINSKEEELNSIELPKQTLKYFKNAPTVMVSLQLNVTKKISINIILYFENYRKQSTSPRVYFQTFLLNNYQNNVAKIKTLPLSDGRIKCRCPNKKKKFCGYQTIFLCGNVPF